MKKKGTTRYKDLISDEFGYASKKLRDKHVQSLAEFWNFRNLRKRETCARASRYTVEIRRIVSARMCAKCAKFTE